MFVAAAARIVQEKRSAISFQLKTYSERQRCRAAEKFIAPPCMVQQVVGRWRLAVGKNTNGVAEFAADNLLQKLPSVIAVTGGAAVKVSLACCRCYAMRMLSCGCIC
jgi:hypothetical protein